MIFIDTNYLLRFLLKDIDSQYLEAKKLLLQAARGEKKVITSTIVFFELFWVLKSYYKKDKAELISTLKKILDLNFIQLKERAILKDSIEYFGKTSLDLEDCYNLAFAKTHKIEELKTFDEKLITEWTKETQN